MKATCLFWIIALLLIPTDALAYNPLKIGLSLGPRKIVGADKQNVSASISPIDSTLQLDDLDTGAIILSATAGLFPWSTDADPVPMNGWKRFCFILHAQLLTVSGSEGVGTFNQSIEGGVGLGYIISKEVSLGLTWEKVTNRVPRDYIQALEGQQVIVDGKPLGSLDVTNDNLYRDDSRDALSIKIMWFPSQ